MSRFVEEFPSDAAFAGAVVTDGSWTVVRLVGELDFSEAPLLHRCLTNVAASAPAGLIVDVAGVSFADTAALGILAVVIGQRREAGRAAWVRSPPMGMRKLARLCELEGLFSVAIARQPGPPVE